MLLIRHLVVALFVALASGMPAPELHAQGLPIPGLPGGLGGITTQEENGSADTPPAEQGDGAATSPGSETTAPPNTGTQDTATPSTAAPTQALIDLLRDDAAREALISELERQAAAATTDDPGGLDPATVTGSGSIERGSAQDAAPAETIADAEPDSPTPGANLTFGGRAMTFTRTIANKIWSDIEGFWLRLHRIPHTLELSLRAFESEVMGRVAIEAGKMGVFLYGMLIVFRFIARFPRRSIARAADGASFVWKVGLRILASTIDAIVLPLTIFVGTFLLLAVGLIGGDAEGTPELSQSQALFVNAFAAVETARIVMRFLLSPRMEEVRLIPLSEAAVQSIWRISNVAVFVICYGQFLVVPVITAEMSVFVGRSVSAVLSSIVVFGFIVYVLHHRKEVAATLVSPDAEGAVKDMVRPLARRWHWPVLTYLIYVNGLVLTQPGNVLLPILWVTAQVIGIVAVTAMLVSALSEGSSRRLRVPAIVSQRLPLLEERLNQLVPALLRLLRLVILVLAALVLLDVLGVSSLGGLLSSGFAERVSSGLFSVLLIVLLLSLVWLAMTSWVDYKLNPFVGSVPTPREITLLTLMKNAVTVALVIIGFITSLAQLGMNVGPLIASAGVIGLAISFGAQRMVEDIFSGVFIQAENAMNVGDVVEVGGTVGTVEKLTVRSVTLRDLSGVVHVIPFSSAAKVSNFMRGYGYHVADMGVAYRENFEDVKQAMFDGFEELRADEEFGEHVLGDLEWFGLNSFGASEVQMRARIKTVPGQQWGVGREYNRIMKRIFDERGIEIPFPHQTVYFGEDKAGRAPALHLAVERRHRAQTEASAWAAAGAKTADAPSETEDPKRADEGQIRGVDMPDGEGR
ncbi:MAG: mechanosensitive ion channel domain-containing protein [Pseudomonadota bacterium]